MKFDIQELTNPLTADVLARKDFSFASGGGGGGGGPSTPVIAPHNPVLFKALNGQITDFQPGTTKVATIAMNLRGNRLLRGSASAFGGKLRVQPGAGAYAGFGSKLWIDPNPPGMGIGWTNYCSVEFLVAVTFDGAAPDPGNFLGAGIFRQVLVNPADDTNTGDCDKVDLPVACEFLYNGPTPVGAHTVDLWIDNHSEWRYPLAVKTTSGIPAPYDGQFIIHDIYWWFSAYEMDIVVA